MKKISQRYIYEMVTLSFWDDNNQSSFYVEYHFEDYFTSRKAAIAFVHAYMKWLLQKGMAKKAIEVNLSNEYGTQLVMYRVEDGAKVEYYGIVRNMILN